MKKLLIFVITLSVVACLYAQNLTEYDKGYIASIRNDSCMKVSDYPGKDVRPSALLKNPSCEISSYSEDINSLIIICTDKIAGKSFIYSYALTLEVCNMSLEVAKKSGY